MVLHANASVRRKSAQLQLSPRFPDLVARAGFSQRAFARRAGVSFSTIMGLLHPELHPNRRGGMQRRAAWLIAHAYAEIASLDADVAFQTLIVERPAESGSDQTPREAEGFAHGAS